MQYYIQYNMYIQLITYTYTIMERNIGEQKYEGGGGYDGWDTRSHSSKEMEDRETEMSGMPSQRQLGIFEDEYQLKGGRGGETQEGRKNHIFIKMSARINGVEFSPDNAKTSKAYEAYHGSKELAAYKKSQPENINKSKVFQKIVQKEAEIIKLKEENRKLTQDNEFLRESGHRKHIKSADRFFTGVVLADNTSRIKVQEQYLSLSEKIRLEQQLSKIQQVKVCLEKKVLDLQALLMAKEGALKDLMKQSQHQINLLYQNLSKRLKAKQVESYMNGKQLKQQKQRAAQIALELSKALEQKSLLDILVNDQLKQKQQLLVTIKQLQEKSRKGKVIDMRLQHTENQLKYLNQELKRVRKQKQEMFLESRSAQAELIKIKKDLAENPNRNNHTPNHNHPDGNLLNKPPAARKDQFQDQHLSPNMSSEKADKLQKHLLELLKKHDATSDLLAQANQTILKLQLSMMNGAFKKMY